MKRRQESDHLSLLVGQPHRDGGSGEGPVDNARNCGLFSRGDDGVIDDAVEGELGGGGDVDVGECEIARRSVIVNKDGRALVIAGVRAGQAGDDQVAGRGLFLFRSIEIYFIGFNDILLSI